ncbi:hypothetical protein [Maribacter arcticus]|uniref:Uncharacterized protein n=1 Tax=Maribacter arcticus TaxID=561365 RepID=A0A1T5AK17_9FLAO|nr:hypothetical protein [Maribacter arcticus]SKB35117.1 hypothetical protein SAMN05660866_01031 [Maribacter arcticus]
MDGRKFNGGHSTKGYAGRKPKADEDRIRTLSINSLESIFGSEEKAFEHIATKAKDSFPHLKLLLEYAYGKPKESVELETPIEQPLFTDTPFPLERLSSETLTELISVYKEMGIDSPIK